MGKLEGCLIGEVEIELKDRYGKIILKKRLRSKSFVAHFLQILRIQAYGYTATTSVNFFSNYITGTIKDHSNTSIGYLVLSPNSGEASYFLNVNAPANDANYGIRVGSGSTYPTPNDYNLESPIANGTGSGQLLHGAVTVETVTINGTTTSFRIIRTFSNSSGATVTVREIGLSIKTFRYPSAAYFYVLIARDVLASAVDVPNGATLTVRYILSTTT